MTISIGTFDDLQPDPPQPIDRNPSIPCGVCEESYNYRDYWESRYVEGKDWNPAEVLWICDDCRDRMDEWYQYRKREREHKTLTEW